MQGSKITNVPHTQILLLPPGKLTYPIKPMMIGIRFSCPVVFFLVAPLKFRWQTRSNHFAGGTVVILGNLQESPKPEFFGKLLGESQQHHFLGVKNLNPSWVFGPWAAGLAPYFGFLRIALGPPEGDNDGGIGTPTRDPVISGSDGQKNGHVFFLGCWGI